MTARLCALLLTGMLLGCTASEPEPEVAPDPVPGLGEPIAKPKGPAGATYRAARDWKDETEGPLTTLVYVGASGVRDPKPHPIIFSSDPNNTYFWRENNQAATSAAMKAKFESGEVPFEAQRSAGRARLTVRRLYKAEMKLFLEELAVEGYGTLPWSDYGFRERIGPERALYIYKDATCRRVAKQGLEVEALKAFTRVERKIIALSAER